eukprot:1244612-Pyramimonas_sp.AAC.1
MLCCTVVVNNTLSNRTQYAYAYARVSTTRLRRTTYTLRQFVNARKSWARTLLIIISSSSYLPKLDTCLVSRLPHLQVNDFAHLDRRERWLSNSEHEVDSASRKVMPTNTDDMSTRSVLRAPRTIVLSPQHVRDNIAPLLLNDVGKTGA